jgi:hypothetical protein
VIQPHRDRLSPFAKGAAAWASVGAPAALLLRFPPDRYSFYPRCPIYTYLHLQCPGCGTTRALAALLHGHISTALHLNPLTTLLIPVALLYTAHRSVQGLADKQEQLSSLQPPSYVIYTLLAIAAIFTITRNLSV